MKLTGIAPQYLTILYGRRQVKYVKPEKRYVDLTAGKIVFPYAEAQSKFGISPGKHNRALKQLHEFGFIDVTHFGGGMEGDCNTYGISQRWKQFGSPDFKKKEWPKDTRRKGNPKIKNHGKGRNGSTRKIEPTTMNSGGHNAES